MDFIFPYSLSPCLFLRSYKVRKCVNITVEYHIQNEFRANIYNNIQNRIFSESVKYHCEGHSNWEEIR